MNNEPLDQTDSHDPSKSVWRDMGGLVLKAALLMCLAMLLIINVRLYIVLPYLGQDNIVMFFVGLLMIALLIITPVWVARRADKLNKEIPDLLVGLGGGAAVFIGFISFQLIQNNHLLKEATAEGLLRFFMIHCLFAVWGFLLAYDRISRIRKKDYITTSFWIFTFIIIFILILRYSSR